MKIAALYDIHGNLPALNAVLEEIKEQEPDLLLLGGDIVTGPLPGQTLDRLSQFGDRIRAIRGNNDREVVTTSNGQPIKRQYLPPMAEKGQEEINWIVEHLTDAQKAFLANLPEQLVLPVEGLGDVLFCHATPRNDEEIFTPSTSDERLSTIFAHVQQKIVVCGHTHMQFERRLGDMLILNAGSVGMPFTQQAGAYWLLLGPRGYEFHRTPYDIDQAAQELSAGGNPLAQEFVENNVLTRPAEAAMTEALEQMTRHYF